MQTLTRRGVGDAAAGLGLHFLRMSEGPFSYDAGHICLLIFITPEPVCIYSFVSKVLSRRYCSKVLFYSDIKLFGVLKLFEIEYSLLLTYALVICCYTAVYSLE